MEVNTQQLPAYTETKGLISQPRDDPPHSAEHDKRLS
jgi:hypothetical protein